MAPSSTPCDVARRSLLAARDARQAAMDRWLGSGETLVAVSLAIPGARKSPPGAAELFAWALTSLRVALPRARAVDATTDALGRLELWCTPDDARAVKQSCVAIEAAAPAARLVDLDVYSPEGLAHERTSLHVAARRCLCCDGAAADCIRTRRHAPRDIVARALGLLDEFAARAAGDRDR
jgi:holo-ACP synthase CitX